MTKRSLPEEIWQTFVTLIRRSKLCEFTLKYHGIVPSQLCQNDRSERMKSPPVFSIGRVQQP